MTRTRTRARSAALISLLVVAMVTLGGTANAYWRASGSGTGSGASGTMVAVTVTPATASAGLYPGGNSTVAFTVTNPNASPARLGSFSLTTAEGTGGYAVDAGHSACGVSSLTLTTPQTNGGAGWTVPAKVGAVDGSLPVTLTNALSMNIGAANTCQGAVFTVYLTAGP